MKKGQIVEGVIERIDFPNKVIIPCPNTCHSIYWCVMQGGSMSLDSVADLHLTGILTGIRECGEMEK